MVIIFWLLVQHLATGQDPPRIQDFLDTVSTDSKKVKAAFSVLDNHWQPGYAAPLLDLVRLLPAPQAESSSFFDLETNSWVESPGLSPSRKVRARERLIRFLTRKTGNRFGQDLDRWRAWMWALPYEPHPEYRQFKAIVYGQIDPVMRQFFERGGPANIRLDEVDWGGVKVNGIPPLVQPKTLSVDQATYLQDDHIVFGLVVDGQARAYPKRILAWHEMALDQLAGKPLTVVYCTLCGTVIPYLSTVQGRVLTFGTSGLLYRSNKLMFDHETGSLWSALEGKPVIGPLAAFDLELDFLPVYTTTWAAWRKRFPQTTVLDIETGYRRDYSEGAAYRDYFASDELMFQVAFKDNRLPNKAEVLVFDDGSAEKPIAIAIKALFEQSGFWLERSSERLWVQMDADGFCEVLRPQMDTALPPDQLLWNSSGYSDFKGQLHWLRLPSHRVFWFAWYAQHPDTLLIGEQ